MNAFCNALFLFGRIAQRTLVGPLREIEAAAVFDRLRSYVLVKVPPAPPLLPAAQHLRARARSLPGHNTPAMLLSARSSLLRRLRLRWGVR